jgi:hypothetical protein
MRLRLAAAASVVGVLAFAADGPTFRATLSLVKADAFVYDRHTHEPILDLEASDFRVFDEDQPRDIAYFGPDAGPLDLVLLLDVSGSVLETLPRVAEAASNALSVLQPGDRAAVMAFSKRTVMTQALTADADAVAEGIRATTRLRIGLDTDINQAVCAAAAYLREEHSLSRRAILILTDNSQETRIPDSFVDEEISVAGAVLDGFLLRSPIPVPRVTHPGILGFARNSGGEVIEGSRPAARLAEMIRRIKFRYSLHFHPADAASERPRRIRVELTPDALRRHPGAVVRARRLYFPRPTSRTPSPVV